MLVGVPPRGAEFQTLGTGQRRERVAGGGFGDSAGPPGGLCRGCRPGTELWRAASLGVFCGALSTGLLGLDVVGHLSVAQVLHVVTFLNLQAVWFGFVSHLILFVLFLFCRAQRYLPGSEIPLLQRSPLLISSSGSGVSPLGSRREVAGGPEPASLLSGGLPSAPITVSWAVLSPPPRPVTCKGRPRHPLNPDTF